MKIWVIGSWYEVLPLIEILAVTDHEIHVFWDRKFWPYTDKSFSLVEDRIMEWIRYLREEVGVDKIILPPFRELYRESKEYSMPLFTTYLHEFAWKYSIVGKIWVLCDHLHVEKAQNLLEENMKTYALTENQSKIKKFHFPFAFWKKEVRLRKYFLTTFWKKDWMVRKTIKNDLRYFKDAAVDTLVPMSRGMFFYQRMIKHMVSWKHMRFHGKDALAESITICLSWETGNGYSITLHMTDQWLPLQTSRERVLTRWWTSEITYVTV